MKTKYRLGYPYANPSPEKLRNLVVVLKPNSYAGYSEIQDENNNVYALPQADPGPSILHLCHHGVTGNIIEEDNRRKTSIAKNGRVNGAGMSMQLALVLAIFAQYQHQQKLPLVLFSAAIKKPIGAPSFLDATITTYCDADEIKQDIYNKYQAAKMAKAVALVLPTRDAYILSQKLNQKVHNIDIFKKSLSPQVPKIVAVDDNDLPKLAENLGICKFHYREKRTSSFKKLQPLFTAIFSVILLWWVWQWLYPKDIIIHDENFDSANYEVTYFTNGKQVSNFPEHANAKLILSGHRKLFVSLKVKSGDINAAIFFKNSYKPSKQGAIYKLVFKATAMCNEATIDKKVDHNGRLYFYFAIKQDDTVYITNKSHELLLNDFRICEETATQNNFKKFENSYLHIDKDNQPNFSAEGSEIEYGFIFFGGTKSTVYVGTCGYIEKWSVVIRRREL